MRSNGSLHSGASAVADRGDDRGTGRDPQRPAAAKVAFSFDGSGRLQSWSSGAQKLLGYEERELKGRAVDRLPFVTERAAFERALRETGKAATPRDAEFRFLTKGRSERRLLCTFTGDGCERSRVVEVAGLDVTESEAAYKRLGEGRSYMIKGPDHEEAMSLFLSISSPLHKGLLVTRCNLGRIAPRMAESGDVEIRHLGRWAGEADREVGDLHDLVREVQEFVSARRGAVVLIDGMCFLPVMFDFGQLLQALFEINDRVWSSRSLLLLHVNPDALAPSEIALLESEFPPLPRTDGGSTLLGDELFEMLRFLAEENVRGSVVHFKKIIKRTRVSYVTVAKRIGALERLGLVYTERQGKTRLAFVTEKGKSLVEQKAALERSSGS